tara:strand:- start:1559 stop:1738 length:180 start_codon:yes stop_codon:yes gene_type:complete
VTIAGIGFFQMTIKDMPIIFLIALAITIQLPTHIAITYIIPPLMILDYFSKKRKVSLDK